MASLFDVCVYFIVKTVTLINPHSTITYKFEPHLTQITITIRYTFRLGSFHDYFRQTKR